MNPINDILGSLGDSFSNAQRKAPTSPIWIQHLASSRQIDFGTDAKGQPFYYAEASIVGNTNADNVAHQQAKDLLSKINAGARVSAAVIEAGAHDFGPISPTPPYMDDNKNEITNTYSSIYSNLLTGATLAAYTQRTLGFLMEAVNALSRARVRVILADIPDFGDSPLVQQSHPDPAKRKLVTNAVANANSRLRDMAKTACVPVIDFNQLVELSQKNPPLVVGKVTVTQQVGPAPAFWIDTQHPGGIPSGVFANMVIHALNHHFGYKIQPLTDDEILKNCGL